MRWSEQIKIIALEKPTQPTNEHGFDNPYEEKSTIIFANKKSVGYAEYYKAQQAGYKTELKFDVYSMEYDGQEIIEYPVATGKRYRVLRTYTYGNGEFTELTLVDLPQAEVQDG